MQWNENTLYLEVACEGFPQFQCSILKSRNEIKFQATNTE